LTQLELIHFDTIKDFKAENKKVTISSAEVSQSVSPMYLKSQFNPYNPDKLYRKKGNYDIYDEMREDDAIKAILMTKKYLMLNAGYEIVVKDEEDPMQVDAKEFLENALTKEIEIDFNNSLLEMLTAMDYGVSFTEVIWKFDGKNYWLKYLKTRAPHGFDIYTDTKGNIERLEQSTQTEGYQKMPVNKFIVFPYQMEFDNWYGKSDLLSAYKAWWSKEFIIKAWNIFLDRFGMPLAIGKFDSNVTSAVDQTKLQTILDHIQTKTAITIPKELEIEFLEATRRGDGGYEAAINNYNMMIARSMLAPDLLGLSGSQTGGGSYALGEIQTDMFMDTLEWTRKELQRKIQRKVINPLVEYNFNIDPNDIPQFIFNPISNKDKMQAVDRLMVMKEKGIDLTPEQENWAFGSIGAPKKTQEDFDEAEEKAKAVQDQMNPDKGSEEPEDDANDDVARETPDGKQDGTGKEGKPKDGKPANGDKPSDKKGNPDKADDEEKKMTTDEDAIVINESSLRAPIMAEKKVDFVTLERKFVDNTDKWAKELSTTFQVIQEDLIMKLKKGKWIENKRTDKVNDLTLKNTKTIETKLKASMRSMFNLGLEDAKKEINVKTFVNLNEEEMFDLVVNESAAFTTANITADILTKAKLTISNGIKEGLSTNEVVKQIKDIFAKYDVDVDGANITMNVRTTSTNAYNSSKMAYFQPSVDSGDIKAYQYSAILDGRTSAICNSLNGKIFLADEVSDVTPPLHPNCRSLLIPITKDEVTDKSIFGATDAQNSEFFPNDKFKPSDKNSALTGFETTVGGMYKPIPKGK